MWVVLLEAVESRLVVVRLYASLLVLVVVVPDAVSLRCLSSCPMRHVRQVAWQKGYEGREVGGEVRGGCSTDSMSQQIRGHSKQSKRGRLSGASKQASKQASREGGGREEGGEASNRGDGVGGVGVVIGGGGIEQI